MGMIKCSECGQMISDKAAFCPQCGHPVKRNEKKYVTIEQGIIALLVIALILVIVLPGPWKTFNAPISGTNETIQSTPSPQDYEVVPLIPETSLPDIVENPVSEDPSLLPTNPASPVEPSNPETPETPASEEPSQPAPEAPSVPESPAQPTPEAPSVPEAPTPETPSVPETPASETYTWNGDSSLDFTAYTNLGENFTLSNQAGNVVLLNFWATWCGPCVGEMPALQRLYDEYGDDNGVRIITVEIGESSETVHRFLSQNGYTLPCIYDTDYTISDKYYVSSIPYTVIFGKDGTVYETFTGAADAQTQYNEYHSVIVEALNE